MSDAGTILGVRLARNGPVLFVAASGVKAATGDSVIVVLGGKPGEMEATVIVEAGQMLSAAVVEPAGRVVRTA